jgi:hypothetical protein
MWDVVLASTVTPNTYDIVACTGVPSLALVLRTDGIVNVKQFGAISGSGFDSGAAVNAALNSRPVGTETYVVELTDGPYYSSVPLELEADKGFTTILGNKTSLFPLGDMDYLFKLTAGSSTLRDITVNRDGHTLSGGVLITGSRVIVSGINSFNQTFPIVVHAVGVKESFFSNFRIDNDTASAAGSRTGIIFQNDYCVNNTFNNSFIGFAENGVLCSTVTDPVNSNKSEGILISDNIIVHANSAVKLDAATLVNVDNNVLDFCNFRGVEISNGARNNITNNWIASESTSTSFAAVGVIPAVGETIVATNQIVDNNPGQGNSAFSLNSTTVTILTNTLTGVDIGFVHPDATYVANIGANTPSANLMQDGLDVVGTIRAKGKSAKGVMNIEGTQGFQTQGIVGEIVANNPTVNSSGFAAIRGLWGNASDQVGLRFSITVGGEKHIMLMSPLTRNVELLQNGKGIEFISPDGLTKRVLTIDNGGNPVWT